MKTIVRLEGGIPILEPHGKIVGPAVYECLMGIHTPLSEDLWTNFTSREKRKRKEYMDAVKIISSMKGDANKRIASGRKQYFILPLVVGIVFVLNSICVKDVSAQKVLSQTGFENYTAAHKKSPFQPSENTVKIGKKSLMIFANKLNAFHLWTRGLRTDKPIVSIEFWVYIGRGGKSFGLSIYSVEEGFKIEGGPYIDWNDGIVRCHVHQGNPWRKIRNFPVNRWQYVRIVSDFEKNVFDFYMGDNRKIALTDQPRKDLPFQEDAPVPRARWFGIFAGEMTTRSYMDDLLIYEGREPLINLAVEPTAKLATTWGRIKQQ